MKQALLILCSEKRYMARYDNIPPPHIELVIITALVALYLREELKKAGAKNEEKKIIREKYIFPFIIGFVCEALSNAHWSAARRE